MMHPILAIILSLRIFTNDTLVFALQSTVTWNRSIRSSKFSRRQHKFPTYALSSSTDTVTNTEVALDDVNIDQDNDLASVSSETTILMPLEEQLSRKTITVSASIKLPFSADIAFDAFSDLPRQPSWSSWLRSVSYVDDDRLIPQYSECGILMQETKWVMGWKNLQYTWNSQVTRVERPYIIEWESTSGLKNTGTIQFLEEQKSDRNDCSHETSSSIVTNMVISLKFIAPRLVASVFRRSNKLSAFMEVRILVPTLLKFRDIMMEKDLGMDAQSIRSTLTALE